MSILFSRVWSTQKQILLFFGGALGIGLFALLVHEAATHSPEKVGPHLSWNPPVLAPIGPSHPIGVSLPTDTVPGPHASTLVMTPPKASLVGAPVATMRPALQTIQRRCWCLFLAGWKALCVTQSVQRQTLGHRG